MKFEFSGKSKLFGRKVFGNYDRIAFAIPKEGLEEYVLSVRGNRLPDANQEPDLFRDAIVENPAEGIAELEYPKLNAKVVLLTMEADNKYRGEYPDLIQRIELFKIDL